VLQRNLENEICVSSSKESSSQDGPISGWEKKGKRGGTLPSPSSKTRLLHHTHTHSRLQRLVAKTNTQTLDIVYISKLFRFPYFLAFLLQFHLLQVTHQPSSSLSLNSILSTGSFASPDFLLFKIRRDGCSCEEVAIIAAYRC